MRKIKMILLILIDMFLVNMSFLLAINLTNADRFNEIATIYANNSIVINIIYIVCFGIFRMYKSLWDYTGTDEVIHGVVSTTIATCIVVIYSKLFKENLPMNTIVLGFIFIGIFIIGIRVLYRIYRKAVLYIMNNNSNIHRNNVMIIGAGSAGSMIINEMISKSGIKYKPIVLIDDDPYKRGKTISGIKVAGNCLDIPRLSKEYNIDLILIAIPSMDSKKRGEIIEICQKTSCKIKIIPGVYEIISGEATVSKIKDVELEDLLGRDPVVLDNKNISEYLQDKVVLITGGGGSIGSELCRQIISFKPKKLIIFDIYENNAYDIQNELIARKTKTEIITLIGSVRDDKRLEEVFTMFDIDVVFHAAAHKHVPLMEKSPQEAVKNNVIGTYNLVKTSDKYDVEKFVLISTDKAVNPTNIMGATKRICEMIIQGFNCKSDTEFVAVRFGNVLGSNGSVIPLFKKQIESGGPITITHRHITRYFMLIPEAAQLVIQAGAFAKGGEIFVLDMGNPVKIYDLALELIKLSGLEVDKDIKVNITGLRPGEKLYEELLMSEEGLENTSHQKIFIGRPSEIDIDILEDQINKLEEIISLNDDKMLKKYINFIVPTYKQINNGEMTG